MLEMGMQRGNGRAAADRGAESGVRMLADAAGTSSSSTGSLSRPLTRVSRERHDSPEVYGISRRISIAPFRARKIFVCVSSNIFFLCFHFCIYHFMKMYK